MEDDIFFMGMEAPYDNIPYEEYCYELQSDSFIIQNTKETEMYRDALVDFIQFRTRGLKANYAMHMQYAYIYPFGKLPYDFLERKENEETTRATEEPVFTSIEEQCQEKENDEQCLSIDWKDCMSDGEILKELDFLEDTEQTAGLETLLRFIETNNHSVSIDGGMENESVYFIGDGNDNMENRVMAYSKILEFCLFSQYNLSFYKLEPSNYSIKCVGHKMEGAIAFFDISQQELCEAKKKLANRLPAYAEILRKEELEKQENKRRELQKQRNELLTSIKSAIVETGNLSMIDMNEHSFCVNGITYTSIDELIRGEYISLNNVPEVIKKGRYIGVQYKYSLYRNVYGQYVLFWKEGYPCFDSFDDMHEDRYYLTCLLCENLNIAYKIYNLLGYIEFGHLHIPTLFAPAFYYDSGKKKLVGSLCVEKDKTKRLDAVIEKCVIYEKLLTEK